MADLLFTVLAVGLVLCFLGLKWGMYATLVAGFLQDPLRKLIADEPVHLSALVILFAAIALMAAKMQNSVLRFRSIPDWNRRMQGPIAAFVLLVIAQSMATLVYTGSVVLAGIGLLAYLAPLPAFMLAYSFASSTERVIGFLWLYVAASAAMASGIYLSWSGVDWDILRTVGQPLTVYPEHAGEAVDLPAGFFRSPEVAAWHAASGFCISVILGLAGRRAGGAWATGALALFFLGAVVLTGRRKFLVEMMVFLPFLLILLIRFRAGSPRLIWMMSAITVAGAGLVFAGIITSETSYSLAEAAARREQQYLGGDLQHRIINMTIGSFGHVLDANGFLGSGAGSGSQGAQHFGGGGEIVGLAAEGGLGKILAEVGVPGIAIFLWVAFNFFVYVWKTLAQLPKGGRPSAHVALGLAAFLIANGIVFISAHQAFGDLFVLLLIGTCFGFIVATRRYTGGVRLPGARHMARELSASRVRRMSQTPLPR